MEPNGDKRRGFAVGDPARRSRDGNGKIAVRGGEATRVQPATARAGGLPPSNKPCEEVPRPICHGSGKHRFLRSENRDEIEEVKQNAMSLV